MPSQRYETHDGEPAPVTFAQVPLVVAPAAVEQALQLPVHVVSQQTPSTQRPLAHPLPKTHAWPCAALQAPAPSQADVPVQAFEGKLSVSPCAMLAQVPGAAPLQVWHVAQDAEPQQTPSTHWPFAQSAAPAHAWPRPALQVPKPLHAAAPAHSLSGSVAAVTFVQVPFAAPVLAALQALQSPLQALLQQKPSTQLPVPHSFVALQAEPCVFFVTQAVPLQ